MPSQHGSLEPTQQPTSQGRPKRRRGNHLPTLSRSDHILEFSLEGQIDLESNRVGKKLHHEMRVQRDPANPKINRKMHERFALRITELDTRKLKTVPVLPLQF